MIEPLDDSRFTHFIEIEGVELIGEYQICEPIGFDGARFTKEQNSRRYSRDREYASLTSLKFIDAIGKKLILPRAINHLGHVSSDLDYGLQWILHAYKLYIGETKAYYILKENGVAFKRQQLDFSEKKITDGFSYITCKVIQNEKVNKVKSTFDSTMNAFSTKNWSEEAITPMPTFNFLSKATPLKQESTWGLSSNILTTTYKAPFNFIRNIIDYGIENTLTSIADTVFGYGLADNNWFAFDKNMTFLFNFNSGEDMKLIKSKNNLLINKIKLSFKTIVNEEDDNSLPVGGYFKLKYVLLKCLPSQFASRAYSSDFSHVAFEHTAPILVLNNYNLEIDIEQNINISLNSGEILYGFFYLESGNSSRYKFTTSIAELKLTATSTSIDQVIKASRWIDLIKQASKYNQNIPINAIDYDVDGKDYKNAVFNKRMVNHKVDFFNTTPKEVFDSVIEGNCDYELKENEIFIGHERKFYENIEIGVFNALPDDSFSIGSNVKAQINKIELGFKKYEQDRTTKGTSESFHTEIELKALNDIGKDTFQRKFEFVRDPPAIQKMKDLEINSPSTSTTEDDTIYIENYIELPPGSFGNLGGVRKLLMRVVSGKVEILNRDSDGEDGDVSFLWSTLGISVGATFQIISGQNVGNYNVFSLNLTPEGISSIITLTPIGFTPTFTGDAFIEVKYFYNNVYFQTRTNEGFSLTEGVSPKFGNLNYTLKRIARNFYERFALIMFVKKKDLIVAKFKSNGLVKTQLTTESMPTLENAPILYSNFGNPLITPFVISTNVRASYSDVLSYLDAYDINRGFARIIGYDNKVYKVFCEKLNHEWQTNKLTIDGEQMFETEYLKIDLVGGDYFVNDTPYELNGVANWYKFENDYIKLYDNQNRPLSNNYKYNLVLLNNVIYDSRIELEIALGNLEI